MNNIAKALIPMRSVLLVLAVPGAGVACAQGNPARPVRLVTSSAGGMPPLCNQGVDMRTLLVTLATW